MPSITFWHEDNEDSSKQFITVLIFEKISKMMNVSMCHNLSEDWPNSKSADPLTHDTFIIFIHFTTTSTI